MNLHGMKIHAPLKCGLVCRICCMLVSCARVGLSMLHVLFVLASGFETEDKPYSNATEKHVNRK